MSDFMTTVANMNAREPGDEQETQARSSSGDASDVAPDTLAARTSSDEFLTALLNSRDSNTEQGIQARNWLTDGEQAMEARDWLTRREEASSLEGQILRRDAASDADLFTRDNLNDLVKLLNTRELYFK